MKLDIKKLEEIRRRSSLTKAELSRRLKLTDSTYGKILCNQSTKLITITRLADILHVSPYDILKV